MAESDRHRQTLKRSSYTEGEAKRAQSWEDLVAYLPVEFQSLGDVRCATPDEMPRERSPIRAPEEPDAVDLLLEQRWDEAEVAPPENRRPYGSRQASRAGTQGKTAQTAWAGANGWGFSQGYLRELEREILDLASIPDAGVPDDGGAFPGPDGPGPTARPPPLPPLLERSLQSSPGFEASASARVVPGTDQRAASPGPNLRSRGDGRGPSGPEIGGSSRGRQHRRGRKDKPARINDPTSSDGLSESESCLCSTPWGRPLTAGCAACRPLLAGMPPWRVLPTGVTAGTEGETGKSRHNKRRL